MQDAGPHVNTATDLSVRWEEAPRRCYPLAKKELKEALQVAWVLPGDDAGGKLEISFFQLLVCAWVGLWQCPRRRTGAGWAVGSCAVTAAGGCSFGQGWGFVKRVTTASRGPKVGALKLALGPLPPRELSYPGTGHLHFPVALLCLLLQFFSGAEWCSFPPAWRSDCCMVPLMTRDNSPGWIIRG